MDHINRLIRDAKIIEQNTAKYMRVCIVVRDESDRYHIRGMENTFFDSEEQAVKYCREQAEDREVAIIIDDIPRSCAQDQTEIAVFEPLRDEGRESDEKNESADENIDRGSPDAATHFKHGSKR